LKLEIIIQKPIKPPYDIEGALIQRLSLVEVDESVFEVFLRGMG